MALKGFSKRLISACVLIHVHLAPLKAMITDTYSSTNAHLQAYSKLKIILPPIRCSLYQYKDVNGAAKRGIIRYNGYQYQSRPYKRFL